LLVDGTVRCWGANYEGEIGDGTTDQRDAPVIVESSGGSSAALADVVAIAAGGFHTCALLADGTVRCWGGAYGLAPVVVKTGVGSQALSNVIALAAGAHHTCALMATGTVQCWGENYYGALGDGTKTYRPMPVTVRSSTTSRLALSGVRAIAAGQFHTCALLAGGTVKCWGLNVAVNDPFGLWTSGGQLGDGTTTNRSAPVTVKSAAGSATALSTVRAIATGGLHTCALLAAGTMKCWGDNTTYGQIGDGTVTARRTPVSVRSSATVSTPLSGIAAIVAGQWHTCALLVAGPVKCWGSNTFGHLGDGTTTTRHAPVTVRSSAASSSPLTGVSAIATEVFAGQDGGGDRVCALLAIGAVKCWGDNAYGTVGDGTTTERHAPVNVINLP
jgi:alpha-tubulin suppressor-like RCC1 family protein